MRILIVDDSSIIRSHCRSLLNNAGYEAVEAWDAAQAKDALNKLDLALMLCDLNLPAMNGLDLVQAMRAKPVLADLPVVILTSECTVALLKRSKQLGVKHWLLKPYTEEGLLDVVSRYAVQPPVPLGRGV